jgi:hypothetical protein
VRRSPRSGAPSTSRPTTHVTPAPTAARPTLRPSLASLTRRLRHWSAHPNIPPVASTQSSARASERTPSEAAIAVFLRPPDPCRERLRRPAESIRGRFIQGRKRRVPSAEATAPQPWDTTRAARLRRAILTARVAHGFATG